MTSSVKGIFHDMSTLADGSPWPVAAAMVGGAALIAGVWLKTSVLDRPIRSKHWPSFRASLPSMEGKVVAITGCSSGIGLVLAKTIAELKGTVIMLNRASSRADGAFATVSEIAERFGAPTPILIECDLSRFSSVKK